MLTAAKLQRRTKKQFEVTSRTGRGRVESPSFGWRTTKQARQKYARDYFNLNQAQWTKNSEVYHAPEHNKPRDPRMALA